MQHMATISAVIFSAVVAINARKNNTANKIEEEPWITIFIVHPTFVGKQHNGIEQPIHPAKEDRNNSEPLKK